MSSKRYELLSVLMPAFNEARTIRTAIRRVLNASVAIPLELIVVDDGSTDDTASIVRQLSQTDDRIKLIRHDQNRGKGSAVQTAIAHMSGDVAIVQDADLEYDPADFPLMLAPILEGRADAVIGSRFAAPAQRRLLLFWNNLANRWLNTFTNLLNNINLTDMTSCYKAVRADVLRQIPLVSKRFGIEPELVTRFAQWNLRIYEVPVSYHGRTRPEGKKIRLRDALAMFWHLVYFRFLNTRFTTHEGYYILESVRTASRFNRWMLRQFRRFVGARLLEAGCGIGNFTELLLDRQRLICVDLDDFYVEMIDRRFGHLENLRTMKIDLADTTQCKRLASEKLDTIICLNVLEHIENDESTLKNFLDVLEPGGHAVILVPAHPWLYTACDRTLGHFRRYTPAELRAKLLAAGFEIASLEQFNRLGVYGWWVSGKLRKDSLSPFQMRVYELLLPLAMLMDRMKLGPGLSVIGVGRKPVAQTSDKTEGSVTGQALTV